MKCFSIWEGECCRSCTLTFNHDRIFMQCSGCQHPFDVISIVIHEMGHQMPNHWEHWCKDGHCLVWDECANHLGAILHRRIVQTPPNQLSGVLLELCTQYGCDCVCHVGIGTFACGNTCCQPNQDELTSQALVSNIGFIMVHGLNEGHIAPYTDIEFQLTKYQTYIIMKF